MRLLALSLVLLVCLPACRDRFGKDPSPLKDAPEDKSGLENVDAIFQNASEIGEKGEGWFAKIPTGMFKGVMKAYCLLSPTQALKNIDGFSVSVSGMTGIWPQNPFGVGGGVEYVAMLDQGDWVGVPFVVWRNQYGGYPPGPASAGMQVSVIWGCDRAENYRGYFLQPTAAGFSINFGLTDEFLYAAYENLRKKSEQLRALSKGELYQDPDKPKTIDDFRMSYEHANRQIVDLVEPVAKGSFEGLKFRQFTFDVFMTELNKLAFSTSHDDEVARPFDLINLVLKEEGLWSAEFQPSLDSMTSSR